MRDDVLDHRPVHLELVVVLGELDVPVADVVEQDFKQPGAVRGVVVVRPGERREDDAFAGVPAVITEGRHSTAVARNCPSSSPNADARPVAVTGSQGGVIRVWDLTDGRMLHRIPVEDVAKLVALADDDSIFAELKAPRGVPARTG
ncbi:hypothetical protein ACGF7U_17250 [Micromonospora sp. NPDC047670]|uniref:hypothetical protein n=1 Tax=Micromonospora sp. NPDC047670 TaxID=3364252 RepID=UPI00371A9994